MIVVVIDEGLEITNFNLFLSALALHQRIKLEDHPVPVIHRGSVTIISARSIEETCVTLKKFLNDLIAFKLVIGDAEDLECLLSSHETALNAKTFFGYLLATLVTEFLHR